MQKRITRNVIIMAVVTVIMGVVLALYINSAGPLPGAAAPAGGYTDGSYTDTQTGCLSDVTVTVTVAGGALSGLEIDASGETPALGGAAAETLAEAILAAGGTAGVDAISGSTMTSDAILAAVDNCLQQAAQ